mmetsp:Transcript_21540/g.46844  ORF Transcript_21540/g.46844 Transcript_21540/m.46844 type:complete len:263 (-) Transcript_21540:106-894(-)|eukprot:CAMPEP_0172299524 /NCGR_PEP_ID=MMETSP1058-20130122/1804_1 /TAXON_ID=83371 /ORGANISM="Detonula confervacea, Strain CCMP 353" /LENGTH=262 /DNA_ID=CAMNT_0013008993 /DNA_START=5 /DNA_END=793 /DNA_ORIENTATION=+
MESTNAEVSGIPPIITTIEKNDECSLYIPLGTFEKSDGSASNSLKDESTADETFLDSSSGFSSCDHTQSDSGSEEDADVDPDDEASSTKSHHTNDSTRLLLKQAQQRLDHQSIHEEVKLLRAEVSQYRSSAESTQRQKLALKNRCNTLESQLAQALECIQSYKLNELQWNEERAEREKDFMNQLNDVCSTMEAKEQDLIDEIVKRDLKIIGLQNNWNEEVMRRMRTAREREKSDIVAYVETKAMKEMHLEDSWSDESSCEFI